MRAAIFDSPGNRSSIGFSDRLRIVIGIFDRGTDRRSARDGRGVGERPRVDIGLRGEGIDPTTFVFKSTNPPVPASPIDSATFI